MHAYSVEITGAVGAYKFLEPRPSILRSTCTLRGRQRDELEVRGGCIMPANVNSLTVTLHYQSSAGAPLTSAGTATCDTQGVVDESGVQEGLYRFRARNFNFNGTCPFAIRAKTTTGTDTRYHWAWQ